MTAILPKPDRKSKYAKCPDCGLKIRCGDIERHKKGMHHIQRVGNKK